MSGVFISYRREDSGGYAGRLFDMLSARFGRENTFMDIDAISGGDNFVTVIEQKIGLCEVLLAVIGERWLTITEGTGTRRLDNPSDFVRLEVSKALARGVRVIPILVSKATMPRQEDLPEDLRPLSLREAIDLRDEHFRDDANRLIDLLARTAPGITKRRWKANSRLFVPLVAFILVVCAAIGGILVFRHSRSAAHASVTNDQAPANIAGNWQATVTYDWPGAVYPEAFDFEMDRTELSGSASFLTVARGIFDGKIDGNRVTFTTKTASEMDGKISQDLHHYRGTVEGDTIKFSMLTDSSIESHVPIHFAAKRVGAK